MATHLQSNGPFVGVVRSASCCAGARPNQAGPTSKAALACRGKQHQELLHLTGIHRVQSDRHCYRPLVRMLASSSQLLPAARLSSRSHGSSGLCTVVHPRIVRQRAPLAAKAHRQEDGQAELTETFSALQKSMPLLAATSVAFLLLADSATAADAASGQQLPHTELFQLADSEDFWLNMQRYGRFAVSSALGLAYVILKPLADLLKKPQTAIPLAIGLFLSYKGLIWTLNAMLGMGDPSNMYD